MDAYRHEAQLEWMRGDRSPHGAPWHTSFHSSSFPGTNDLACGRKAVYDLLDPPSPAPREPSLQAMFDQGLDLEHHWVSRLKSYGALLSADVTGDDDYQTGFQDPEHWLTGGTDAIVLPRGWTKGLIVEIKTTSKEKIIAMRANPPSLPFSHDKYVRQILTYIAMAHEMPFTPTVRLCAVSGAIFEHPDHLRCPEHVFAEDPCFYKDVKLSPPDCGELVYSAREEPMTTVSFKFSYDPEHMRAGRAKLAEWRDAFLSGQIPEHPREHRRVGGGKIGWSFEPCKWCDLRKTVCQPDWDDKITTLSESHLVSFAEGVRPGWSYEEKRRAVLTRWGAEDPTRGDHLIGSSSEQREEASVP